MLFVRFDSSGPPVPKTKEVVTGLLFDLLNQTQCVVAGNEGKVFVCADLF